MHVSAEIVGVGKTRDAGWKKIGEVKGFFKSF
jgi:hypothetical protein